MWKFFRHWLHCRFTKKMVEHILKTTCPKMCKRIMPKNVNYSTESTPHVKILTSIRQTVGNACKSMFSQLYICVLECAIFICQRTSGWNVLACAIFTFPRTIGWNVLECTNFTFPRIVGWNVNERAIFTFPRTVGWNVLECAIFTFPRTIGWDVLECASFTFPRTIGWNVLECANFTSSFLGAGML